MLMVLIIWSQKCYPLVMWFKYLCHAHSRCYWCDEGAEALKSKISAKDGLREDRYYVLTEPHCTDLG